MSVFDPEEDDDQQSGSLSVASALRGGNSEQSPDETPVVQLPEQQGGVDYSAEPYMRVPDGYQQEDSRQSQDQQQTYTGGDEDTYLKPVSPPAPVKLSPYADHSADYAALQQQKQKEAGENTKPSVWRRIGAGLAAGAVGFGTRNAEEGMKVGQEINNAPLANAQHRWAMEEAPLNAKIADDQAQDAAIARANAIAEQQGRLSEQDFRNQSLAQQNNARAQDFAAQAAARRNAITSFTPYDPKNPYAGGTGTTADGRTVKDVAPPDKWLSNWEKNPENVAAAQAQKGVATLKALEAAGVKLNPEQRAIVASGGKVTPSTHTNISIRENPDGSAMAPKGSKISQSKQDEIINQKNSAMQKAQQMMAAGTMAPEEAQQAMQDAQDNFEQRIEQLTGSRQPHHVIDSNFKWSVNGQQQGGGQQQQAASQQQQTPQGQQQQQAAPKAGQPSPNLKPGPDGMVQVKGPGFSMKMAPGEAREGRTATDDKGRKWIIQGGEFKLLPKTK